MQIVRMTNSYELSMIYCAFHSLDLDQEQDKYV
jgi:hypothetical protein